MIYAIIRSIVAFFCKIVFFVKVKGAENLPKEGAVILAANHTSMWDPVVLVSAISRKMRFMAKKELFRHKLLAPILRMSGAFPVDREGNDIGAIKNALKTLKDGEIFGIFPSGTRVKGTETAEAKSGVALIAARSGAPVLPVAISGGFRLFKQVTIHIGQPLSISYTDGKKPSGEELKAFADEIMNNIESLGA